MKMKLPIKRALTYYLDSWWLPPLIPAVFVFNILLFCVLIMLSLASPVILRLIFFWSAIFGVLFLLPLSVLGLLFSWGWLLFRKRRLMALLSFVLTLVSSVFITSTVLSMPYAIEILYSGWQHYF